MDGENKKQATATMPSGVYPTTYQQAPPAYTPQQQQQPYPQQPYAQGYPPQYYTQAPGFYQGQPPMGQQPIIIAPVYQSYMRVAPIMTQLTSSLKLYLTISGVLYILLGVLAIGLEIGLIANSSVTYYRGFWAGGFVLGSGISMLIASCQTYYAMARLVVTFVIALILVFIGFILSIINVALYNACGYFSFCNYGRAQGLKIGILVIFSVLLIQTIVNIIVASSAKRQAIQRGQTAPTQVPVQQRS